jgi:hypothetical protein
MKNLGLTNLSERVLSPLEQLLLSQGLSYIPLPPDLSNDDVRTGFNNFRRSIRLRKFFLRQPSSSSSDPFFRVKNSAFDPPPAGSKLEFYISSCESEIKRMLSASPCRRLAYHPFILEAIHSLVNDPSIVIKPCDKNLGVAVLSRQWYESECLRQLSDSSTYRRLDSPPCFDELYDTLSAILSRHGMLHCRNNPLQLTKAAKYILQLQHSSPKLARFYILPKIHKSPVVGRPICASIQTQTFHASRYLDKILQPIARRCSTFIKDSFDIITIIESTVFPANTVFMTADVTELYPSIDIEDGLAALRHRLLALRLPLARVNFILDLAAFVLRNNYIEFGDTMWHQIRGTAMGTSFAVVFAIIYLSVLEEEVMEICLATPGFRRPLLLRRFIDDIISCFLCVADAELFVATFRTRRPTIRLTFEIDMQSCIHQDILIFKGERFNRCGKFDVRLYQKEMNQFLYLPASSFHPVKVKQSFIQAELARARIRCSSDEDFKGFCDSFFTRLLNRGYSSTQIDDWFKTARLDRTELLNSRLSRRLNNHESSTISKSNVDPLIFKVPFTKRTACLNLRDCLRFTDSIWYDMDARFIFDERRPPILCFKRAKNLGDFLVSARYESIMTQGTTT